MSNPVSTGRTIAAALALCAATGTQAASLRASCDTFEDTQGSMTARYLHTAERATFDVSYKAPAAAGSASSGRLVVFVDGRNVGFISLTPRADGGVGGSLSFDSYANAGYADPGVTPFPENWPGMRAQAPVRVGPLGCQLAG